MNREEQIRLMFDLFPDKPARRVRPAKPTKPAKPARSTKPARPVKSAKPAQPARTAPKPAKPAKVPPSKEPRVDEWRAALPEGSYPPDPAKYGMETRHWSKVPYGAALDEIVFQPAVRFAPGGDIRGSYSADLIAEASYKNKTPAIRKPFEWDGALWASTGSLHQGPYTYYTHARRLEPTKPARSTKASTDRIVTWKKQAYKLGEKLVFFVPDNAPFNPRRARRS